LPKLKNKYFNGGDMEQFTEEEKKLLNPFFSNINKDVFVLMNLPEAVKGALFSRYSRSTNSLRRTLLKDFIKDTKTGFGEIVGNQVQSGVELGEAIKRAESFYSRILDGYGDDSVAELGGAHLAVENVSNLGAKKLEDCRLSSPLEKSSRYVFFHQKVNGDYQYYKEPVIMESKFSDQYKELMRLLFGTYERLIDPMMKYAREVMPMESFMFFDPQLKKEVPLKEVPEEKKKRFEIAYNSSVRALACDVLRYLLPCATLTNVGIYANGRSWEYLTRKCYSDELSEMRELAPKMHHELNHVIPSFVRRAKHDEYIAGTRDKFREMVYVLMDKEIVKGSERVNLVKYDENAEEHVISSMLYENSKLSMQQISSKVKAMSVEERKRIMDAYVGARRTRRDKPYRAMENTYYTFDVLADFGAYRDMHRHRLLTQARQDLSCDHGYEFPEHIVEAGYEKDFKDAMDAAKQLYNEIKKVHRKEAQYVVPFAYKIRWYMAMNLREVFHLVELRSTKQGHASYRRIAQDMYKHVKRVHPNFAEYLKFVDLNEYKLARLDAEVSKEEKRAKLE
jgi:thymidylate synthase ThyX